ncbi:hypothetical protein GUITHDRAFT_111364 [Guillardia theta CCMP2712]|uniref:Uncharacterized protein n=1 Tax=Guillardia theta (strain CCMP2712) TaxID=905079 RepID=L1J303_GUITC|nr:hypothetical protein GUITHDRAFT_111364 [Guillardia theta CCMP2712]EKX42692.1 hypothetical protein GUITHDRAFT_111364 [Guillardia theta CCMP2712]|eukprot:XP_005829672.1 hypothetical protein GUITHDRAFT_111364 [Guillardia theta CCMP2712]
MSKKEISNDKMLELEEENAARNMQLAATRVRLARTTQLPMTRLHWGHDYLKSEYGDNWDKQGGYWDGCGHMFKSLCHGRNDMWWEKNGWSDANAKLQKAAQMDQDRQKMFREALKELHNKILEEREAHKEAKVARQEYLNFTKYNLKLKEKKKKFLLNSEKKSLIDTLAKSSAIINSGLVHKIANDTDMAYADYGEVEAQAAQEEMDEMAKWHNLLLNMKESGKADPLYVANLNQEGTKMLAMIRHTMLRLQHSESREKKMAQEDERNLRVYQQQLKSLHDSSQSKEKSYEEKEKEEELKAEEAAKKLLQERSQEFAGEGSSAHNLAEESAKRQEAARQRKLQASDRGSSQRSQAVQHTPEQVEQNIIKQKEQVHAAAVAKKNALVGKAVPAAKEKPAAASKGNKGGAGKAEAVELAPWAKQRNFMSALKRQTEATKQL